MKAQEIFPFSCVFMIGICCCSCTSEDYVAPGNKQDCQIELPVAAVPEYVWVLEESNCSAVYVENLRAYEWQTESCNFRMVPLTCLRVNNGYECNAGLMANCHIETSVPYDGFFLRTYANENAEVHINDVAATLEFPDSVLPSYSVKLPWGFKVSGHPEDELVHIYGRGGSYFVFFPMVPVETQIITVKLPFCIGSQKHEFSFVFHKEHRDMPKPVTVPNDRKST